MTSVHTVQVSLSHIRALRSAEQREEKFKVSFSPSFEHSRRSNSHFFSCSKPPSNAEIYNKQSSHFYHVYEVYNAFLESFWTAKPHPDQGRHLRRLGWAVGRNKKPLLWFLFTPIGRPISSRTHQHKASFYEVFEVYISAPEYPRKDISLGINAIGIRHYSRSVITVLLITCSLWEAVLSVWLAHVPLHRLWHAISVACSVKLVKDHFMGS